MIVIWIINIESLTFVKSKSDEHLRDKKPERLNGAITGKKKEAEMSESKKTTELNRNEAVKLLKALSDKSRLEVLDRLKVGPSYVEKIAAALELSASTVSFHLKKLEEVGLVTGEKDQYYMVYSLKPDILKKSLGELLAISGETDVFQTREEAYRQTILDNFMVDGKLKAIPVQRKKKRVILDEIGKSFEFDRRYPEKEVNLIIADFHDDFCTLRREMIMENILKRADGIYWKTKPEPLD